MPVYRQVDRYVRLTELYLKKKLCVLRALSGLKKRIRTKRSHYARKKGLRSKQKKKKH